MIPARSQARILPAHRLSERGDALFGAQSRTDGGEWALWGVPGDVSTSLVGLIGDRRTVALGFGAILGRRHSTYSGSHEG
jgi:hypothetical protein